MTKEISDLELRSMAAESIHAVDEAVGAALSARLDPETGDSVLDRLETAGFTKNEARALVAIAGNAFEAVISRRKQTEKHIVFGF